MTLTEASIGVALSNTAVNSVVATIFEIEMGTRPVDIVLFSNLITVIWGASGKPIIKVKRAARLPEPGNSA